MLAGPLAPIWVRKRTNFTELNEHFLHFLMKNIIYLLLILTSFSSCENKDAGCDDDRMMFLYEYLNSPIIYHLKESNKLLYDLNSDSKINDSLRYDTKSIINFLDSIKHYLIEASGGYEDIAQIELINPRNTKVVDDLFFSDRSIEFQNNLERRILKYESRYQFISFPILHIYEEDPYWSKLSEEKKEGFIQLFIGRNPDLIYSLQMINLWQIAILLQEQKHRISIIK